MEIGAFGIRGGEGGMIARGIARGIIGISCYNTKLLSYFYVLYNFSLSLSMISKVFG